MNSDISLASEERIERKGKKREKESEKKKLTKLLAVYLAMCITQVLCWYDVCLQLHYLLEWLGSSGSRRES